METNDQKKMSILNIPAFWMSQQKPWRITVYRTSMERLAYKSVLPYLSLYIILMGATKAQLGAVTAVGLFISAILGPYLGQRIDREGPKRSYIFGILIILGAYLSWATARAWQIILLPCFHRAWTALA